MTEAVAFPDIEAVLVRYLPPLVDVPVSTSVPKSRPAAFVTVERVGGGKRDLVTDQPLVVVQCWATEETDAADLGRITRAYVDALAQTAVDGDYVRAVREVGGLQHFPDPVSGAPRYQFTVQIDTRGVAL